MKLDWPPSRKRSIFSERSWQLRMSCLSYRTQFNGAPISLGQAAWWASLLCLPSTSDNYLYMYIYSKYIVPYVSYVENIIFGLIWFVSCSVLCCVIEWGTLRCLSSHHYPELVADTDHWVYKEHMHRGKWHPVFVYYVSPKSYGSFLLFDLFITSGSN